MLPTIKADHLYLAQKQFFDSIHDLSKENVPYQSWNITYIDNYIKLVVDHIERPEIHKVSRDYKMIISSGNLLILSLRVIRLQNAIKFEPRDLLPNVGKLMIHSLKEMPEFAKRSRLVNLSCLDNHSNLNLLSKEVKDHIVNFLFYMHIKNTIFETKMKHSQA